MTTEDLNTNNQRVSSPFNDDPPTEQNDAIFPEQTYDIFARYRLTQADIDRMVAEAKKRQNAKGSKR